METVDAGPATNEQRILFHYGINLNNLTYNSPDLQQLRRKYGKRRVEVRWDRSDLGFVHILDDKSNRYLKVPCTWFEYANGLSVNHHKVIREKAFSLERPELEAKLDEVKARVRAIVEKAVIKKKK